MTTARNDRWPLAVTVAAAAILIAPIWAVDLPAMPDLPAHLACFFLLSGGIKHPELAHFYRLDWHFIPNLAAEIVVPFLTGVIGLVAATKLFLSAAVAMWVLGAAAIQRVLFGRFGVAPLLAAFFAYNANFFWGFLNYDFAAGLSLVLFAAWLASANMQSAWRIAVFAAAVTLVYFCHVFAAAALLLMIGCFELQALFTAKALFSKRAVLRFAQIALIAAPACIAFVWLKPHGADGSRLEFNFLSTWDDRLGAAIFDVFDSPAYVTLGVLAAFWVVGLWRGWLRLHMPMLTVLIVFAICIGLMPEWAMGGWGVDLRLPALLGVLAFASVELRLPLRGTVAVIGVALAALIFAAMTAGGNWAYYDRQYAEFRAAIAASPAGTRFLTVLDGDAMGLASDQPYWHMAEFGIIDRFGFTSLLFTTAGQHVVRLQPAFQPIAASNAQQGSPPDIGELDDLAAGQIDGDTDIRDTFPYLMRFQCHYDEAVVIHSGGKPTPAPTMLRLRYRGSYFDLYDIVPDAACTDR
jgi:hypothetical protein